MLIKKPGLRIIKTWIAVFISMVISVMRFGSGLSFYSAIAAIICMDTNVEGTYTKGINRIKGSIIGGLLALAYLFFLGRFQDGQILNLFLLSVFVFILIWALSILGLNGAISIACIVFLSVTLNHGHDPGGLPLDFAINRIIDTLIGVITAIFVNWFDFKLRKKL
ncbi:aromatic acid exporter family protein [Anaerococcus sp. AGMB09787]|uniref:FUSC family protein n=1 Tax=Anaerococcus sp. AGMB09787 TaxID=2922869 RepID=UPI001FAF60DA|nr:aromatic acid exporter family protein [Anaerococcus sp. AGMB09787]